MSGGFSAFQIATLYSKKGREKEQLNDTVMFSQVFCKYCGVYTCILTRKTLLEINNLIYSTGILRQYVAICNGNKFPHKFQRVFEKLSAQTLSILLRVEKALVNCNRI